MRLVLRAEDKTARVRAKKLGIQVEVTDSWDVSGPTLFATTSDIPWDLVPSGFEFLQHWDAAAPLWRYGVLAASLGTPAERKRTEDITHDLRLLAYAPELLFVRDSEAGKALVETWRAECDPSPSPSPKRGGEIDERLAFIRALYLVKPVFCALPRSWLAEVQQRSVQDARAIPRQVGTDRRPLVLVQIGPNQFVKCKQGDEEAVRRRFEKMKMRRGDRRKCQW